jgi:hypothetical protein
MGNQTNPTSDQQHELEDLRDPMSVPDMVHVVISTREEELLWAVFDGFSELSSVRVTGDSPSFPRSGSPDARLCRRPARSVPPILQTT